MTEHALVQSILIEFGALPDLRIWRVNTGAAKRKSGGLVRFGLPGMADIFGIVAPTGRLICIEAKSETGRQTKEQASWQRMVEKHGGAYCLARTVEDVRTFLQSVRKSA